MGRFLKTYRELLVAGALLVLPLVTYASHAETGFTPGPLRSAVVFVTAPIQHALVWTVETAQDGWFGYLDLRRVWSENLSLRAEILRLRSAEARRAELEAENTRLRRLAAFVESQPESRMVTAPVVAYGADPKFRGLRIGRGAGDGFRTGMPVITADGVVGRLSAVYEGSADVQLITDPQSTVAAQSQRSRARASARGLGQNGRLRLDYIVKSDDLEDGDILVTAPSGGLFPKGLKLGRATGVGQSDNGLFKRSELVPAVDFSRLEEVLVIVDEGPTAALAAPAAVRPD